MKIIYLPLLLLFTVPLSSNAMDHHLRQAKAKREIDANLRRRRVVTTTNADGTEQPQAVLVFPDGDDDEFDFDARRECITCCTGVSVWALIFLMFFWAATITPESLN